MKKLLAIGVLAALGLMAQDDSDGGSDGVSPVPEPMSSRRTSVIEVGMKRDLPP